MNPDRPQPPAGMPLAVWVVLGGAIGGAVLSGGGANAGGMALGIGLGGGLGALASMVVTNRRKPR
jgi:hypothetical protein